MTMIAVGQGLRGIANKGMSAVARAEAVEEQQRMGIDAAKQAADSQLLGTGAGIGGMQGAKAAGELSKAANTAVEGANKLLGDTGSIARDKLTGGIKFTPTGGETYKGTQAISELGKTAKTVDDVKNVAEVTAGAGEVVAAGETAVAAGETAVAASQAAGPMAQLSALAGPVAIGLGVSFLLSKLFD